MKKGCYTAIVTPFKGEDIDIKGFEKLIEFQISQGITGILAVGTTGESPGLDWEEHNIVIQTLVNRVNKRIVCIASAGSNNTKETIQGVKHADKAGADAILLVDPYYNGPSSLEIRREYIEPAAQISPDLTIIPYVIPGRTGTQLLPEDLAILYNKYKNVNTVKEATGNIENMKKTRNLCGQDYTILSGDDSLTFDTMLDPEIRAAGVISVFSNIAPAAITNMVNHINNGEIKQAQKIDSALEPLTKMVNVSTTEETPYGQVVCRARNPVPIKTLMSIFNMPCGHCRKPLGKMTKKGLNKLLNAAKEVHKAEPDIFNRIAEYFRVDIEERLNEPSYWKGLYYEEY